MVKKPKKCLKLSKNWANLKLQWLPMVDRHWSILGLVELFAIWSVIYINSDLSILCQTAPSAIRGNRPRWSWLCQSPCTVWVFLSHWGSWGRKPEERPLGTVPCTSLPIGHQTTVVACSSHWKWGAQQKSHCRKQQSHWGWKKTWWSTHTHT